MTNSLKQFGLLATMAGALAVSATAQPAPATAQWANLTHLEGGTEIRVVLADGRSLRGLLGSVSPDSLAINTAASQESLARQNIKQVSLKRAGHRGRKIGMAIGAAAGLGTGAAIDRGDGRWFPNLGKAIFTPLGALVGAVVGVAIPTGGWKVVYRAP
jgi:hypothetical protein